MRLAVIRWKRLRCYLGLHDWRRATYPLAGLGSDPAGWMTVECRDCAKLGYALESRFRE